MHRRNFIAKASIGTICAKSIITSAGWAKGRDQKLLISDVKAADIPPIHENVKNRFLEVLKFMDKHGWGQLIKALSGLALKLDDAFHPSLYQQLNIKPDIIEGYDDFAGNKLIEPGNPSLSLLYHLLASPRVLLRGNNDFTPSMESYATLELIDALENFIYATSPITLEQVNSKNMVLAIFAYEYRPACKTPHEYHADLVFARTGFSRVGTKPMSSYDRINRCFTNLPETGSEKEIASTPARYALFLAECLPYNKVERNNRMIQDARNNFEFLLPIRKVFENDIYLQGAQLFFNESHINEKLRCLCITPNIELPSAVQFDLSKSPFIRKSSSSTNSNKVFNGNFDTDMVSLKSIGSSVLLSSMPGPLVERASQMINGRFQRLRIKIPAVAKGGLLRYSNRRYTSFKVLHKRQQNIDSINAVQNKLLYPHSTITEYHSHRNAPMFVNIREIVSEMDGAITSYIGPTEPKITEQINESYWVGLFEDKICDGCIAAEIVPSSNSENEAKFKEVSDKLLALQRLPAFSIVTAPDFFPLIESYDMSPYEDLFLVGGVEDMGGARKRANPSIVLPGSGKPAFPQTGSKMEERVEETVVALISHQRQKGSKSKSKEERLEEADKLTRNNYLPDSATKIFFPGWDITYSGGQDDMGIQHGTFYSTYGLGSPFVEDAKLCAAVNGMWAAASPDSSRTYRTSLTTVPVGLTRSKYPPTAVPLLDKELGFHAESPARTDYSQNETTGWDGEQGPFLVMTSNKLFVNFTDIGRADYVKNALAGTFDMSHLRRITTAEVKFRMDCFKRCFRAIGLNTTELWLVGAEKVESWNVGAQGFCIPKKIFQTDNSWATKSRIGATGGGYLYLFARTKDDAKEISNSKRMTHECSVIYLFQVSKDDVAYSELKQDTNWTPHWMQ